MLSESQVAEVERLLAAGNGERLSQRQIAARTGVSRRTIGRILCGAWRAHQSRRQQARARREKLLGTLFRGEGRCCVCGAKGKLPCLACMTRGGLP